MLVVFCRQVRMHVDLAIYNPQLDVFCAIKYVPVCLLAYLKNHMADIRLQFTPLDLLCHVSDNLGLGGKQALDWMDMLAVWGLSPAGSRVELLVGI